MRNILFVACLFGSASLAQEPPKTMTKLEVLLQSPDVTPGSFATKPKLMYRAGSRYCRTEEAPNPDRGIHGLMIIKEPDAWMVNLLAKTAQHVVDPGPTFNCHMPIFADIAKLRDDETRQIMALEFGLELEFFKSKGAIPKKGAVLQGKETTAYMLDIGESTFALFTYGTPERPLAVMRKHGDKADIFWYSGYGQVVFDPKLFAKPENVKIEDPKPQGQ